MTFGPVPRGVPSDAASGESAVFVRYGGGVAAVATPDAVVLLPAVAALERDHPRRRFVTALALVARLMTTHPVAEPYDDDLARFYARTVLMPNAEFEELADLLSDAELAEHYNLPLDQVRARREDVELGW